MTEEIQPLSKADDQTVVLVLKPEGLLTRTRDNNNWDAARLRQIIDKLGWWKSQFRAQVYVLMPDALSAEVLYKAKCMVDGLMSSIDGSVNLIYDELSYDSSAVSRAVYNPWGAAVELTINLVTRDTIPRNGEPNNGDSGQWEAWFTNDVGVYLPTDQIPYSGDVHAVLRRGARKLFTSDPYYPNPDAIWVVEFDVTEDDSIGVTAYLTPSR